MLGAAGAVALAALVVGLVLADREEDRRDASAAYVADLNRVLFQVTPELEAVNRAYGRLGERGAVRGLETAEATMREVRADVAALDPPAEAEALHAEVLELLDLQAAFARDVTELGRALPEIVAAERALAAATGRLGRELAAARTADAQERPFTRYRARLAAVEKRLAAVDAPSVLAPTRTAELARVERLSTLARRVRTAIAERRTGRAAALLEQLAEAARRGGSSTAERRAVEAFNARRQAIAEQQAAVEEARARLARALA